MADHLPGRPRINPPNRHRHGLAATPTDVRAARPRPRPASSSAETIQTLMAITVDGQLGSLQVAAMISVQPGGVW